MSGEFCVPWLKSGRLVLDDESKLVMLSKTCPCKSVCEREIPRAVKFPFPFAGERLIDSCTVTLDGVTQEFVLEPRQQFRKFSSSKWYNPEDLNPDYDSQAQLKYEAGEITYSQYMETKDKYHYKSTDEADPENGDVCDEVWSPAVYFRSDSLWLWVGWSASNKPTTGYTFDADGGSSEDVFYKNVVTIIVSPDTSLAANPRLRGEYNFATKYPFATHGTNCEVLRGAVQYPLPDTELTTSYSDTIRSRENGESIADWLREVCNGKERWFTRKINNQNASGVTIYRDGIRVTGSVRTGYIGNWRNDGHTYTETYPCDN